MKLSYATSLYFQKRQRGGWHEYLSEQRKQAWQRRFFRQFMDEQIKLGEIPDNAKR
jgi:hypothetical protein